MLAWLACTLPFLTQLTSGRTSRDVEHYFASASAAIAGAGIYTSVPFEYPPYALAWFAGPAMAARDADRFRVLFGLALWVADAAIKAMLVWLALVTLGALGGARKRPDLVPLFLFTLVTAALARIVLQRFDLIPVALSVAAAVLVAARRPFASGVVIAMAVGTKGYPALFIPAMAAFAGDRVDGLKRFAGGVALGLAPIAAAAVIWPWWRFVTFHSGRGLEAGSLWSSAIWLLHFLGLSAEWGIVGGWVEVSGPAASAVLRPAEIVWLIVTAGSVWLSGLAALRIRRTTAALSSPLPDAVADLSVLLAMPVVAFVAFSPVLSPQFHLWFASWSALVLLGRHRNGSLAARRDVILSVGCLLSSSFLVPIFYPTPSFDTGLDLARTLVLLFRNLLLVIALLLLWRAALKYRPRTIGFEPLPA